MDTYIGITLPICAYAEYKILKFMVNVISCEFPSLFFKRVVIIIFITLFADLFPGLNRI
jgi:hypothetical protein